MLAEYNNAKKDEQELRTTGQIKNPNSIQYRRNVRTQPDIKQDNISTEQRNAPLNPLQRPLIYLANPEKVLGDLGVSGMETSELDRQKVNANRFNPYQSRTDRFINNAKIGLEYVPEATVNTAMAAAFMPEGAGGLGLVNEALNPLAGIKTSIPDELRQGLNSQGFLDIFKSKDPIEDIFNNKNLESIGSLDEYKEYLQKTYPKGYQNKVVYHGGKKGIEDFKNIKNLTTEELDKFNRFNRGDVKENLGYYFTPQKYRANQYSKIYPKTEREVYSVLLNTEKPFNISGVDDLKNQLQSLVGKERFDPTEITQQMYDSKIKNNFDYVNFGNTEHIVFDPQNIHILGSNKDVEAFNQYVNKLKTPYTRIDNKIVQNTESLPKELEPYISKRVFNDSKEQQVFESSFQPEQQSNLLEQRSRYYDNSGNEISKPDRFLQQGGQQKFTENELAFLSEIAIKDNNGYWNKNNQGKVVEINGNQITMKGVDQDLIGISKQTGEKKIMKPNKNYTFSNTKSIIEIPFFKK